MDIVIQLWNLDLNDLGHYSIEIYQVLVFRPVRVQYDERKCRVCAILGDEYHFLLECYIYCNLRTVYIRYFMFVLVCLG